MEVEKGNEEEEGEEEEREEEVKSEEVEMGWRRESFSSRLFLIRLDIPWYPRKRREETLHLSKTLNPKATSR